MISVKSLIAFAFTLASLGAGDLPACCRRELSATAPLPEKSIYQASSAWTNDQGAPVQLASFRGKPVVLTMFFARCEFACPLLVNDMKWIESALPEAVRRNVQFVLVSFDSERDTPAALAAFRKTHQLPANWTLLRGAPDDVQELAALLGTKYKKDGRGQYAHSNLITLLSPDGEVSVRQAGLNQAGTDIASAVMEMTNVQGRMIN